jgi:hypothetical protein
MTVQLVPFSTNLFFGFIIASDELQNLTFFWGGGRGGREQREGIDLLEYQAMPSFHVIAHDGVFCVHLVIDHPQTGTSGEIVRAGRMDHHIQNHILLGRSPPASQAGRRVGPAL